MAQAETLGDKVDVCWYDQSSCDVSTWWTNISTTAKTKQNKKTDGRHDKKGVYNDDNEKSSPTFSCWAKDDTRDTN